MRFNGHVEETLCNITLGSLDTFPLREINDKTCQLLCLNDIFDKIQLQPIYHSNSISPDMIWWCVYLLGRRFLEWLCQCNCFSAKIVKLIPFHVAKLCRSKVVALDWGSMRRLTSHNNSVQMIKHKCTLRGIHWATISLKKNKLATWKYNNHVQNTIIQYCCYRIGKMVACLWTEII